MRFKLLLIIMTIFYNSLFCQTWTNIFPNPSEFNYRGLYMDTTGLGIFVGDESIITKTNDFGITYTNVHLEPWSRLNAIEKISDSIFIAVGNHFVLRSKDSGTSWTKLDLNFDGTLKQVKFLDETRGFIVGTDGIILKSNDGGMEWEPIHLNDEVSFTQINFINDSIGYIWGAYTKFYKTINRGETWEEINWGLNDNVNYIHFWNEEDGLLFLNTNPLKGYVYEISEGGGVLWLLNENIPSLTNVTFVNDSVGFASNLLGDFYKTINSGQQWVRVFDEKLSSDNSFYIVNEDLIIAATEFKGLFLTNDQGENWASISKLINEDLTKVIFSDNQEVYVTGENGLILKSIDTGLNFIKLNPGSHVKWNDIIASDDNTVIVVGDSSTIIKSVDGGITWQQSEFDFGNFISMDQIHDKIWLISDVGHLLKSNDRGSSWTESLISAPSLPSFIYFISESTGFIRHENGKVSMTIDGGESWEAINDIEWSYSNCLQFIDDQVGYVAGDKMYKTLDGGMTWNIIASNLPAHGFFSIFFRDENVGYLSGVNGVIAKTIDGGQSWTFGTTYTTTFLSSVAFQNEGVGLSVGINGTILRIEEGDIINNTMYLSQEISSLKIHPNPANDAIFINSDRISDQSLFQIFDLNGKRLLYVDDLNNGQPINIKPLPVGVYILTHKLGSVSESSIFLKQ